MAGSLFIRLVALNCRQKQRPVSFIWLFGNSQIIILFSSELRAGIQAQEGNAWQAQPGRWRIGKRRKETVCRFTSPLFEFPFSS